MSDAATAAFKDTHTDLRCAEFGKNLAMELQEPSCGRISKMDHRSKSRLTHVPVAWRDAGILHTGITVGWWIETIVNDTPSGIPR